MCTQDELLKIGQVLKDLMKKKGLSLKALSSELGIPKTTLFGYIQNTMPGKELHVIQLCKFFSISSDQLLFNDPPVTLELEIE